jgi:hypothetical protein
MFDTLFRNVTATRINPRSQMENGVENSFTMHVTNLDQSDSAMVTAGVTLFVEVQSNRHGSVH